MKLMRGLRAVPGWPGQVVTIGSFDGLHQGHRELLRRAVAVAREQGLAATLLTFEPLPREYFAPRDPPPRLTCLRERWRVLQGSGLDNLCVLRFNAALRQLDAEGFAQLLQRAQVRVVVVGHDFKAGRDGQATAQWLQQHGPQFGFQVQIVPPVLVDGQRVGSRVVRDALRRGDLATAARLLGRRYGMTGRVRRGQQLGRTLGFPTLNLPLARRAWPCDGIFAVWVHGVREDGPGRPGLPGVASLGTRPTVQGREPLLEVHLFDFEGDLYGREVQVQFVARLRDELKFESLELMVAQMHRDAALARAVLAADQSTELEQERVTDYKQTVNLPQTDFPMKADLARREGPTQAWWESRDIYGQMRRQAAGRPRFALHDGPPYANGAIHIGHATNKVLKDFIVKSRALDGYDSPYIPGWDCHGLPIELQVEKKHGRVGQKLDARAFRAACRAYAQEQVQLQSKDFQRLGVLGDWHRPYLTMDPAFEAQQIRALGKVIANGHLYKGAKPVHWCLDCRSALAEAEVEYEDKTSPAIDVAFAVADTAELARRLGLTDADAAAASLVIWTTTPWTLPANEAVALKADLSYVLVEVQREQGVERLVLAEGLRDACLARYGLQALRTVATCEGAVLEGLQLQHPFLPKQVPVVLGDHVTLEAGTGAVHTAPAHGQDDFIVGRQYGLPVVNPVGGDGRFFADTPIVGGQKIDEGGKQLIELMQGSGRLLRNEPLRHSYPHCWRHKTPVIFRATPQWFISMDQNGLRAGALRDIATVRWIPAWGEQRISGMIAGRPDWCISRQRTWGVPITLFVHKETGELHPRTQQVIEAVAALVEKDGIDAWFDADAASLIGADDAQVYDKVTDVMDVWADSGSSFECVAHARPELAGPVEMYLEGSDQHRGWFHSSLLMSEALYGRAPYKNVLTHGFTVDDKGRKMSKSLGNVVAPDKVVSTLGADVLRLWVAATDYTGEMSCSEEILKRTSDSYRRLRNTARFLLGNLHGFDPQRDAVPADQLVQLDAWAIARAAQLQDEVVAAYRDYQFLAVYQKVHTYCVVELGGLYLDVIKDRLYTTPAGSLPRRSAQTALFHIAQAMTRWLAPILSFTAEEIWQHLPGAADVAESVFLAQWHVLPAMPAASIDWDALAQLRAAVLRRLEVLRDAGSIGSSLDAELDVYCLPHHAAALSALGDELRFYTITSGARVQAVAADAVPAEALPADTGAGVIDGVWLWARPATAAKCVRCWHKREDVGSHVEHPQVCGRCAGNVLGLPETRRFA